MLRLKFLSVNAHCFDIIQLIINAVLIIDVVSASDLLYIMTVLSYELINLLLWIINNSRNQSQSSNNSASLFHYLTFLNILGKLYVPNIIYSFWNVTLTIQLFNQNCQHSLIGNFFFLKYITFFLLIYIFYSIYINSTLIINTYLRNLVTQT